MGHIILEQRNEKPLGNQRTELVERKGVGHPDTICDAISEAVSCALCREYQKMFGRILHHNVDKALLVAGRTEPRLGGGKVIDPMRLVLGDRATAVYQGTSIDVGEIAHQAARTWVDEHLRFVDRDRDLVFQNELKQGSLELTGLFERQEAGANDTSAAVGYAPLSETEKLVLAAEKYLNSLECTKDFPEAGEDVKVMAYRLDGHVFLTVAVAFADRFIPDVATYFERKEALQKALYSHLSAKLRTVQELTIEVNTLDDATRGEEGMYLTVLGTSAEGADCGQVGRGNRVNGLITLRRPMSTEAAAGKNPTNHVGKIYSVLTHKTAMEVYSGVPEVAEVFIWLGSQIGRSIADPAHISAHLVLHPGAALKDVSQKVQEIIDRELSDVHTLTMRLARGEIPVW